MYSTAQVVFQNHPAPPHPQAGGEWIRVEKIKF